MAAMTIAVAELPDDVDALKAMIVAMAEQRALLEARTSHLEVVNKTADERIATLTAIVRMLERSRFGTRSERMRGATLNDEQHAFVFDEIKTGLAAIEAELESTAQDKPKRAPRSRKGFAADLERIEIVIEPEIPAGCEGLEKVLIGEDVSERLDVMPAKFRVIVTRRPKYASRSGDCVARHLAGYTGILQVDGYSAYTRLAKTGTGASNETVTLAGCWAHLRRRLCEVP